MPTGAVAETRTGLFENARLDGFSYASKLGGK
jgi:hypothetical protein